MKKSVLAFVLLLFVNVTARAQDFNTSEERVMEAYLAYYGRPADTAGLEYWSNRLAQEGGNIDSIIKAFGESQEYTDRFGTLSNIQLVTNIYHQLFDREPDKGGLDFYVDKLSNNEMSLQAISLTIFDGVTGNDKTIVNNKLTFSRFYVTEGFAESPNLSAATLAANVAKINDDSESLENIITIYRRTPEVPLDDVKTDLSTASEKETNVNKKAVLETTLLTASSDDTAGEGLANKQEKNKEQNEEVPDAEKAEEATADTLGPVMSIPGNISMEASSADGANVSFTVTAIDEVDGAIAISCSNDSGSDFPIGTTSVRCEATDAAGNNSTESFTVSVADTTAPQLLMPANRVVEATETSGVAIEYQANANDSVDRAVSALCGPLSGSMFVVGDTTVNCEATDSAGNVVSGSFLVSVVSATAEEYVNSVTLIWSIPTTRENGDPVLVGELVGYEIYIIAEASGEDQLVTIGDPLVTEKVIENLKIDTYHFFISAIDIDGQKSEPSNLISAVIQAL
jgi:hypothetical protein